MKRALRGTTPALHASTSHIELEVPPLTGLGQACAGVAVAQLLYYVTPRQALSVLAALLLERRVVLTGCSPLAVALAVHAAAALLHPFVWHHIYLPLVPAALTVHSLQCMHYYMMQTQEKLGNFVP